MQTKWTNKWLLPPLFIFLYRSTGGVYAQKGFNVLVWNISICFVTGNWTDLWTYGHIYMYFLKYEIPALKLICNIKYVFFCWYQSFCTKNLTFSYWISLNGVLWCTCIPKCTHLQHRYILCAVKLHFSFRCYGLIWWFMVVNDDFTSTQKQSVVLTALKKLNQKNHLRTYAKTVMIKFIAIIPNSFLNGN